MTTFTEFQNREGQGWVAMTDRGLVKANELELAVIQKIENQDGKFFNEAGRQIEKSEMWELAEAGITTWSKKNGACVKQSHK